MKPLNDAILKYFTTVKEASPEQVVQALKPEYGSFSALKEKAVLETLRPEIFFRQDRAFYWSPEQQNAPKTGRGQCCRGRCKTDAKSL